MPQRAVRQYFPKGTDLSTVTEAQLDAVADELNDRPRKRLAFANPTEQLAELLLQEPPESAEPTWRHRQSFQGGGRPTARGESRRTRPVKCPVKGGYTDTTARLETTRIATDAAGGVLGHDCRA